MKKMNELKNIHNVFVDSINELDIVLQKQIKKTKQEFSRILIEEKVKFLQQVCNDEGLDFEKLKVKYFKQKELSDINKFTFIDEENSDEVILDKVTINGKEFYYEPKEKGIVYDLESKPVGLFKNGQVILS